MEDIHSIFLKILCILGLKKIVLDKKFDFFARILKRLLTLQYKQLIF